MNIEYGELRMPDEPLTRNPLNGRFMKGHVPDNKGKPWQVWMSIEGRIRSSKGWKNLEHRKGRSPAAGKNKKAVIAVGDNGKWMYFPHARLAAERFGGSANNIRRCCRFNESRKVLIKGKKKMNTDHRYKAIRWYFECDDIWMTKIEGT